MWWMSLTSSKVSDLHLFDPHAYAMWVWYSKSIGPGGRPCTKLSTPNIIHNLKHWYQYTDSGLFFFLWCQKMFTTLSWAVFLKTLTVAHLFLDICFAVFGPWINQKNVMHVSRVWISHYIFNFDIGSQSNCFVSAITQECLDHFKTLQRCSPHQYLRQIQC